MNNKHAYLKPLVLILVLIVVAVAGYTVFAYTVHMWPFKDSLSTQNVANKPTDSRQQTSKKVATATTPQYNLKFTTLVKAAEQGDCALTMTKGNQTLSQTGSSKGQQGQTGCPEWKLDTSKLPAGDYKVSVVFTGETITETSVSTIKLP